MDRRTVNNRNRNARFISESDSGRGTLDSSGIVHTPTPPPSNNLGKRGKNVRSGAVIPAKRRRTRRVTYGTSPTASAKMLRQAERKAKQFHRMKQEQLAAMFTNLVVRAMKNRGFFNFNSSSQESLLSSGSGTSTFDEESGEESDENFSN